MEFSIGIGYLTTHYREYVVDRTNFLGPTLLWANDGRFTWIGPTKVKLSLTWLVGNREKKGGYLR